MNAILIPSYIQINEALYEARRLVFYGKVYCPRDQVIVWFASLAELLMSHKEQVYSGFRRNDAPHLRHPGEEARLKAGVHDLLNLVRIPMTDMG